MAEDKVGVEGGVGWFLPLMAMLTMLVRPRHETQSDHLAPRPNLLRGKGGMKGGRQKGRSVQGVWCFIGEHRNFCLIAL